MNILRASPKNLFLAFVFAGLGVASGAACAEEMTEIAHPFFTHEGLPDAVGSYSTRLSGLATRIDGTTKGDFAFHVETGLTESIGLHLRSDQFLQERRTELMLQFAAFKSQDGESGFAPIIELGFPTRSGGGKTAVVVGFTSKLASSQFALNQAFHYDPADKAMDGSVALVLRASERFYPVLEALGRGGKDMPTVVNLLAGMKYRVGGTTLIGFAYQRPVSRARELSSQFVLQLEFMFDTRAR